MTRTLKLTQKRYGSAALTEVQAQKRAGIRGYKQPTKGAMVRVSTAKRALNLVKRAGARK